MNEIELITKALKDAYEFVKEQERTKETCDLLITLFKAEILVKNFSIPAVSGSSAVNRCNECSKELESGTVFCSADCRQHYYH